MSAPVRGVDVSSWQHPEGRAIDWEKAKGAGYHFALVKASQGTGYVNQWVAHDLDSARAAGLLVGAYHYFEANQPAEQQASHFLSCLVGQDLGLGVWLDWECYEPVQFAHSVEINSFLATVREARPTCGVYCDESWAEQLKKDNVPFGRLWLAVDSDTVPKAGQYMTQLAAGPVAGIEGDVDIDVLANTRGVDIPTSPAPRATEAQVAAVRAAADEPEPEA